MLIELDKERRRILFVSIHLLDRMARSYTADRLKNFISYFYNFAIYKVIAVHLTSVPIPHKMMTAESDYFYGVTGDLLTVTIHRCSPWGGKWLDL